MEGFEKLYEHQRSSLKLNDPLKRLHKHGEAYIQFALENPQYYDLMFMMRGPVKEIQEINDCDIGLKSYELRRINYIVEEALNFMLVSNNTKKCDLENKLTISGVDI
jgi:hypothetical protein